MTRQIGQGHLLFVCCIALNHVFQDIDDVGIFSLGGGVLPGFSLSLRSLIQPKHELSAWSLTLFTLSSCSQKRQEKLLYKLALARIDRKICFIVIGSSPCFLPRPCRTMYPSLRDSEAVQFPLSASGQTSLTSVVNSVPPAYFLIPAY